MRRGQDAGRRLFCWFQSDIQPSLLVDLSLETPACAQTPKAVAISTPRWVEAWLGSSESQGNTLRAWAPGVRRIGGGWLHSVYHPHPCTDLSSGFPGWCAGLEASITPILSCRSQEENSFQLNYPSHSNIITLQ